MRKNSHSLWQVFTALPFFLSLVLCFLSAGCRSTVTATDPQLVVIDCNTGIIHTVGTSFKKMNGPQFQLPDLKQHIIDAKE